MTGTRLILALTAATLVMAGEWRGFDGGFDGAIGPASAWAADDDDDDDGGGGGGGSRANDDDDDDGPRVMRRAPARQAAPARRTPAPARPAPPPPTRADNEVLARGLSPEALTVLEAEGFTVMRQITLAGGEVMHRLRKPRALGMDQARARVTEAGARADFNHFYRGEQAQDCQGADCPARQMIDWPDLAACTGTLPPAPVIGMIDTGLNAEHGALADAQLQVHRLDHGDAPSGMVHGTAVAALLVGADDSRSPGLVGHMPLLAVDAFHSAASDERADAFTLVEGLDWLAARDVRVINLSLSGPDNVLLAEKVAAMEAAGVLLVAAAGNGGPRAAPAFPAGYETVLAVTAVDRRGEVYRRAGRGAHIDLAAPGVDVWTAASISGARTKTGTSFAAPFVTAAAALMMQAEPELTPAALRDRLREGARDLGSAGPDAIFGHGLLAAPEGCPTPENGLAPTLATQDGAPVFLVPALPPPAE